MTETISTLAQERQEHGAAIEGGQRTAVTVLGFGMMGAALATAFVSHGHPTTVWNRSAGKTDGLVARGARLARTVAEAVAASELIVVCVSTYEVVRELLDPLGDALADRTLVNLTTGTPQQARELAAWAAERRVDNLDGAIMAIPSGIDQPDTILLYSGHAATFQSHRSMLELLGGGTTYLGADAGLATLYDMALLSTMYALYGGFLHALALVGTAAVDGATFVPYADRILKEVVSISWRPGRRDGRSRSRTPSKRRSARPKPTRPRLRHRRDRSPPDPPVRSACASERSPPSSPEDRPIARSLRSS